MWDAWNVDRLYMGGVQVKMRAHAGLNHQKSVILHDQDGVTPGDQTTVIFGSSNWTSPSANGQVEHNIFTTKQDIVDWFNQQFERKWNNTGGVVENKDFLPLPPDAPITPTPADGATGLATTVTLKWFGGPWAHLYDVYIATNASFTDPQVFRDLAEDPAKKTETSLFSYALPVTLTQGTTYYWKVVGKTMALKTKTSATFSIHHRRTGAAAADQRHGGSGALCIEGSREGRKLAGVRRLHGGGRREDPQPQPRRGEGRCRERHSPELFRAALLRRSRARPIRSGSAARPTATTGRTIPSSCSSTTR